MKKINKNDIFIFLIILTFSFIICSGYLKEHYSADTFNIINIGYEKYAIEFSLLDGRVFMCIIGLIANRINLPIIQYIIILELLAIVIGCVNVIVLKNTILKYKKITKVWQKIFLIIICYYTIFNFTYIENLYFVECFVMSLSILFYILAAKQIIKKEKSNIIKGIIFIFLGLISYQGTISALFIFTILFSILEEKNIKELLKVIIKASIMFAIAFLINFLIIDITENIFSIKQTRTFRLSEILNNIGIIICYFLEVLTNTCYLFPKYLYLIFMILISILVFLKIIKQNNINYNKNNQKILFEQLFLIFMSIAFAFIPSIYHTTAFFSCRIRFSIGAMIGILFIHLIVKTNLLELKVKYDKILIGIFIVYGLINSINYMYLINLNIRANELDKKCVDEINNYIEEYQEKENVNVRNICLVTIENNVDKAFYEQMDCFGVGIAVSSVRTIWATQGIINYYTDRELIEMEFTEDEKQKYIKNVDEEKNYLCMGDTLFVSIYWR